MNRKIKFRGKRIDNGDWVYGYLVDYGIIRAKGIAVGTVNMSCDCEIRCEGYRISPETVGQFTGLFDKNGKEIYEGDIVDFIHSPGLLNEQHRGVVLFFGNTNWALNVGDKEEYHIENAVKRGDVIGSIHDNPELLTNITHNS